MDAFVRSRLEEENFFRLNETAFFSLLVGWKLFCYSVSPQIIGNQTCLKESPKQGMVIFLSVNI